MKHRKIKKSAGERVFDVANYIFIGLFTFACVFPFLNMFAKAFSSDAAIVAGKVTLIPVDFQIESMKRILHSKSIMNSMIVTIFITVVGTLINMTITVLTAYPLSRPNLKGKSVIMNLIILTMMFSGGMIPTFLVVKQLHLLNTVWSLIIPGALSTFNLIVMKSFFQGLPIELEEAATIDGCGKMGILRKIILPLSKPSLATISLFYAVGHWNSYFNAMLYIDDPRLYTLQVKLRQLLLQGQSAELNESVDGVVAKLSPESLNASTVVFATIPILIVYPFLQKYFVKGVTVGAVKG